MLKDIQNLRTPDPYFAGESGFIGSALEQLHDDMRKVELPDYVPESVRRCHDAVRNAYIYSYCSYDLLTLAASQTFPCLEFALRLRIVACTRFRRHRVRCFDGTGGVSWSDGSLRESSSLRLCG